MYATVTTWRLRTPVPDDAVFDQILRDLMRDGINVVRQAGVIDVITVELGPDTLVVISLYDSLDEAIDSGPYVVQYVEGGFADRFELVSRITGAAYEISQFAPIERTEAQAWREGAAAIYGNLATWRLDASIRAPAAFAEFVRGALDVSLPAMRELGLLDAMGIRLSDDALLVLRLFEDPVAFETFYGKVAMEASRELIAGKVALIEQTSGRAFDMMALLGDNV